MTQVWGMHKIVRELLTEMMWQNVDLWGEHLCSARNQIIIIQHGEKNSEELHPINYEPLVNQRAETGMEQSLIRNCDKINANAPVR